MNRGYLFLVFLLPFLALGSDVLVDLTEEEEPVPCKPFDVKNPCQCVYENGSIIDFSEDGFSNGTARFYQQLFNESAEDGPKFSFNPCFPFSDSDNIYLNLEPRCRNTMSCYYKKLDDPILDASIRTGFGKMATGKFFLDKETQRIGIKYITDYLGRTKFNNLTVLLNCLDDGSKPKVTATIKPSIITVEYSSPCACIDGCKSNTPLVPADTNSSGLSIGSILVILFFVFLVVYILGGITWNVLIRGASGKEVLPNYGFWSNLPGLIVDGACLVCSCCCTKNRDRSSYEDM